MPVVHRPVRPKPHPATQTQNDPACASTSQDSTSASTNQREELISDRELVDLGFASHATATTGLANTAYVPHTYHRVNFTLSRVAPQQGAEADVLCSYVLRVLGYEEEGGRFGTVLHEVGASEWGMLGGAFEMVGSELEGRVWAGFRGGEIGAADGK